VAESQQILITQNRNAEWRNVIVCRAKRQSPRSGLRGDDNDCGQL